MYQFTQWCKRRVVRWRTSKHVLGSQPKSSYSALASHEFLLLFISFHFEVYLIENKCSEKRETYLVLFFFPLSP